MVRLSVATMYAWRWMAELERGLIGRLTWKELAFLVLQLPLGTVAFTVAVTVLGTGRARCSRRPGRWLWTTPS